ncbi:MAG: polysaccharide biosynthesis protein [Bacteroidetes bacterium]|nr:polysaccharide biosynthesis protein [Bacteroidota bacterium]
MEGVKVFQTDESLEKLLQENEIKHLIIAISEISKRRKAEIAAICLRYNTKVLDVPPVKSWIKGELSFKQIKKIKVEDLLERDPIVLDTEAISTELNNKTILITGAAGSIGSEIVRQVINFNPAALILLDTAESALYDLEQELKSANPDNNINYYIADIKNELRMATIFGKHKPEVVFHAAAYKHVPLMEENVSEAVANNIFGTCMVTDTAIKYGCKKMVMVSTDKAVNPTNVMGASKRIAEMYCQWQNKQHMTRFVTTRFGNVLGSNGSVIPLFKKQIEDGKNITVTHPDITRYFMTIPEACQLVLEAGTIGQGGEIFVFDMGTPVRIADLAQKMITLSGLKEGRDIEIKYTGLRPGEKLYEELLNDSENVVPTHHPKIKKAKLADVEGDMLTQHLARLKEALLQQDDLKMVSIMKELVPEFISNNSFYSRLDEKKDKS